MKMPLFPLSSHILPAGRMALRIFEPRYVRMIKESCANNTGFVICMLNQKDSNTSHHQVMPLGTVCKVVDFDVLPDGLLGITVEGVECVSICDIESDPDNLRKGICTPLPEWLCNVELNELHPIDQRLKEIFQKYPEVSSLYNETNFDDPMWVIHRWIELLPVGAEQKQHFISQGDCKKALSYLSQLID